LREKGKNVRLEAAAPPNLRKRSIVLSGRGRTTKASGDFIENFCECTKKTIIGTEEDLTETKKRG